MSKRLVPALACLCSLLAALSACSPSNSNAPQPCPRRTPAFRLQLTASGGSLPRDTVVRVAYGSNVERYSFRMGNGGNEDVCCSGSPLIKRMPNDVPCSMPLDAAATVPASSRPVALYCHLNTNGAAQIDVVASGYEPIGRTLQAQPSHDESLEHCDALVTRDIYLRLLRADAGL